MNKKNSLIILFATALCLAFLIPSASAGGRWHQSGVIVVYGYPQTKSFSNFVIAWPPYYGPNHYSRHRHQYRSNIYHRHQPPKRPYDRDKQGYKMIWTR
jgi:hypothetical protein